MDEPFHRTLDSAVGGGNLSIGMSGPDIGTAPVALAVHGITGSHRSFRAIARHLGQDLTVLAPDLRGRGASSQLPTPEGLDTHVADLVRVLDGAGVERAVLVGHSMGAYIVARLAAAHPQRASAVVLIDGGIPLPVPEGVDLDDLLAAVLGPAFARLRMEWDSLDAYRQFWRAHPAFARAGAWNDDIGDYVDYDLAGTTPPLRSRVSEAAVKADGRGVLDAAATRRALGGIGCPAVLIRAPRGLLDEPPPLLPDEAVGEATTILPGLVDVVVPDTNHYLVAMGQREATTVADQLRRAGAL